MEFVHGAVAAMGAAFFTNPLDVLKTRMQLQGELQARGQHAIHYRDILQATKLIIEKEGFLALQKGLAATLLTQAVRNGIKLGSYQMFTDRGYICDYQNKVVLSKSLLVSACSGGLGAFFSVPLYKVTVRMQSRAARDIAVGHQHVYVGMGHALKATYVKYGMRGLWGNSHAVIIRSLVGASAQLTTFTVAKEAFHQHETLRDHNILSIIFASWCGAVLQVIFQTPFDVISVRLNNQHLDDKGRGLLYDGMTNCIYKIVKSEGWGAFYKGLGVNYLKVGRHTSLYLIFWELLKGMGKEPKRTECVQDSEENVVSTVEV